MAHSSHMQTQTDIISFHFNRCTTTEILSLSIANYLKRTKAEDFVKCEYDIWRIQRRGASKPHNHTPALSQDNHPFNQSVNVTVFSTVKEINKNTASK